MCKEAVSGYKAAEADAWREGKVVAGGETRGWMVGT